MRENLFRGKRSDNKGWAEGLLTIMWGQYHIINPTDENTAYPIDSKTVCQYTGLTDKNGRKIFEGDIIAIQFEKGVFVVEWLERAAGFVLTGQGTMISFDNCWDDCVEVVGNIFDDTAEKEKCVYE